MCKNMKKKRYFLPLTGLLGLVWIEEVYNYTYLPLVIGFVSFIFFWNFPYFVYRTISKPLYLEDLFLDEKKLPSFDVDIKIKKRFKTILKWTLIFTNTLLMSALSDYYLYKAYEFKNNIFQILGITGGLIKLFEMVNNIICKYILKIMRYFIRKENEKMKKLKIEQNTRLFLEEIKLSSDKSQKRTSFEIELPIIRVENQRERLNTI
jgi:hypothetical protein